MGTRIKKLSTYIGLILLALAMALCYEVFIFKNSFAPAGITGLATMIQFVFDFNVGYMSLIINIPLVILIYIGGEHEFATKSGIFVLAFSAFLIILPNLEIIDIIAYHTDNGTSTILAPIAAGTINGALYAGALHLGGSTGGTDLIAAKIRQKKPYISLVWIIFALNVSVASLSYFVYGYKAEPVILCIIYCFITSTVSDKILRGGKEAIKFEVITGDACAISDELMQNLHHGVTVVNAEGMYSHSGKKIIICIVNKHQIVDFQKIIKKYPDTFAYVSSVTETVGNFKNIHR